MSNIKVAVRVRPVFGEHTSVVECVSGQKLQVLQPPLDVRGTRSHSFQFDYCLDSMGGGALPISTQEDVFNLLGMELLESAWKGYNCSIFAYGQTGTGKSHTMIGLPTDPGLIPRVCSSILNDIKANKDQDMQFRVEISFFEIYNEKVKDLLNPSVSQALKVRQHPITGPYVENLSKVVVSEYGDLDGLLDRGFSSRAVGATAANEVSSRSHAIFTINLTQTKLDRETLTVSDRTSQINLIDLAGSERIGIAGASGQHLKEAGGINRSLSTLSRVITELSEKSQHVPYRESVLTWLLKESLGGNAKTLMIATITPAEQNYEETMSTLRYATRAQSIINDAVINEDPTCRLINSLRNEIARLREQLAQAGLEPTGSPVSVKTIATTPASAITTKAGDLEEMRAWTESFQRQLSHSRDLLMDLCMAWEDNGERAEEVLSGGQTPRTEDGVGFSWRNNATSTSMSTTTATVSATAPVAVRTGRQGPFLLRTDAAASPNDAVVVNFLPDVALTIGTNSISADGSTCVPTSGSGVKAQHCRLSFAASVPRVEPLKGAITKVNGVALTSAVALQHGDRLEVGDVAAFEMRIPGSRAPAATENAAAAVTSNGPVRLTGRRQSIPNGQSDLAIFITQSGLSKRLELAETSTASDVCVELSAAGCGSGHLFCITAEDVERLVMPTECPRQLQKSMLGGFFEYKRQGRISVSLPDGSVQSFLLSPTDNAAHLASLVVSVLPLKASITNLRIMLDDGAAASRLLAPAENPLPLLAESLVMRPGKAGVRLRAKFRGGAAAASPKASRPGTPQLAKAEAGAATPRARKAD